MRRTSAAREMSLLEKAFTLVRVQRIVSVVVAAADKMVTGVGESSDRPAPAPNTFRHSR